VFLKDSGSLNTAPEGWHKKLIYKGSTVFPWPLKIYNLGPVNHALWAYTKAGPSGVGFLLKFSSIFSLSNISVCPLQSDYFPCIKNNHLFDYADSISFINPVS